MPFKNEHKGVTMKIIDTIVEVMEDLASEHKDEYIKEKNDLEKEILQCLKSTNTIKEDKPFFLFLRRFNSFTPALPLRPRLTYSVGVIDKIIDNFKKIILEECPELTHRLFTNIKGGGCFLSWGGKGIVIDPGYDFIENMYSENLAVGDIDAIVITHAHNDHYIDLDPILTLAYQYNRLSKAYLNIRDEKYVDAKNALEELIEFYPYDFAFNALVYCKHEIGLEEGQIEETIISDIEYETGMSEENIKIIINNFKDYKNEILIEIEKGVYKDKNIKLFFSESAKATLEKLIEISDKNGNKIGCLGDADGPYEITEIKNKLKIKKFDVNEIDTYHNDFKRKEGNGLKFNLDDFNLGITSDTGWFNTDDKMPYQSNNFSNEISENYKDCQLLIPHIGSIKKVEFEWLQLDKKEKKKNSNFKKYIYKTHLGILGLLRLIAEIKQNKYARLQLVAITEFGEEMKHMRHYLAKKMDNCDALNSGTKYLAADIGLKIKLPYNGDEIKIRINTYDPKTGKEVYESPEKVEEKIDRCTGKIIYRRKNRI